jgi:uncharacterized cupredoxin-like copper-binding protein
VRTLGPIASTLLAALALAACGDEEQPTTTADQVVDVAAAPDNSLAYEQESLSAEAGAVSFVLNNVAQIPHDFCIEDADGSEVGCSDEVAEGETQLNADLEAGEYTFYCSIAGHRDGGMEGTLTVE